MKKVLENLGVVFLVAVLVIGVAWSLYDSLVKEDPVDVVKQALVQRCQIGVARSELDQRFALEAAKARRRSAETLAEEGHTVKAENELATAKVYEDIAEGYQRLTAQDCKEIYNNS